MLRRKQEINQQIQQIIDSMLLLLAFCAVVCFVSKLDPVSAMPLAVSVSTFCKIAAS